MELPKGATVAVLDGAAFKLFRNTGDGAGAKLTALEAPTVSGDNKGSGARHASSAANPDDSRLEEDSFVVAATEWLNASAQSGGISALAIVAAPKSLGEMRKHYHSALKSKLVGELAKDLAGRPIPEIEAALDRA